MFLDKILLKGHLKLSECNLSLKMSLLVLSKTQEKLCHIKLLYISLNE